MWYLENFFKNGGLLWINKLFSGILWIFPKKKITLSTHKKLINYTVYPWVLKYYTIHPWNIKKLCCPSMSFKNYSVHPCNYLSSEITSIKKLDNANKNLKVYYMTLNLQIIIALRFLTIISYGIYFYCFTWSKCLINIVLGGQYNLLNLMVRIVMFWYLISVLF